MRASRTTIAVVGVALLVALVAGLAYTGTDGSSDGIEVEWVSDTATDYEGNHHEFAVTAIDGEPTIGVPLNDHDDSEACGIVALDATGEVRWRQSFSPSDCSPHAIGNIVAGDRTGEGTPEFVAGTEQRLVLGYDAGTGDQTLEREISSLGYASPVIADIAGDRTPELAIVDFSGKVQVLRANGSIAWARDTESTVLVDPIASDVTGDGNSELAVTARPKSSREGTISVFDDDGTTLWNVTLDRTATSWASTNSENPAFVVATRDGTVASYTGASGERQWRTNLDGRVAIGETHGGAVYATTDTGTVQALDLTDGSVLWTEEVTTGDVRLVSAPIVGDVSGDGSAEVIVTGSDGTIAVLDTQGEILASRTVEDAIYVPPHLADVTGDENNEILVLYGDGRIAALSYAPS